MFTGTSADAKLDGVSKPCLETVDSPYKSVAVLPPASVLFRNYTLFETTNLSAFQNDEVTAKSDYSDGFVHAIQKSNRNDLFILFKYTHYIELKLWSVILLARTKHPEFFPIDPSIKEKSLPSNVSHSDFQASLVYRSFEVTKDNVKQTKTMHIFLWSFGSKDI